MRPAALDKLVWALIFGGLLSLGLGLSVRGSDAALGTGICIVGGLAALIGFALIVVRARMKGDE